MRARAHLDRVAPAVLPFHTSARRWGQTGRPTMYRRIPWCNVQLRHAPQRFLPVRWTSTDSSEIDSRGTDCRCHDARVDQLRDASEGYSGDEEAQHQQHEPFASSPELTSCDVFGNPIVLHFPRLAEASFASSGRAHSWQQFLRSGTPSGLLENEARQWRQEVIELHSVDEAVGTYRARYAQVETQHRLSTGEILERRLSQRELVSAGWFYKLSARFRDDMLAWTASNPDSNKALRERLNFPRAQLTLGQLIKPSAASPRDVALEVLGWPVSAILEGSHGRMSTSSTAFSDKEFALLHEHDKAEMERALCGARERVLALPHEACPKHVRRAMELIGAQDSPVAKTERMIVTRRLQLRSQRGASTGNGERAKPFETMRNKNDDESARPTLGDEAHRRLILEQALFANYGALLSDRITKFAEQLAAITLGDVTSRLLQHSEVEGEKLTSLCNSLSRNVAAHIERQRIVRHRQEQVEQTEAELLALKGQNSPSLVGCDEMIKSPDLERLEGYVGYRRKQLKQSETMNMRQVGGTLKGIRSHDQKMYDHLKVDWCSKERYQLGAYMIDCLTKVAFFHPRGDEIARARQTYWALLDTNASETAQDDPLRAWESAQPLSALAAWAEDSTSMDEPEDFNSDTWRDEEEDFACEMWQDSPGKVSSMNESQACMRTSTTQYARTYSDLQHSSYDEPQHDGSLFRPGPDDRIQGRLESQRAEPAAPESRSIDQYADDDGAARMQAFQVYNVRGSPLRESLENPPQSKYEASQRLKKTQTYIRAHPLMYDTLVSGDLKFLRHSLDPEAKPMLVPPLAWTKRSGAMPEGGQLHVRTRFVRTRSIAHKRLIRELEHDALKPMLDGLNAMSRTAWRVNQRVLSLVEFMWEAFPKGLPFVADCPSEVEIPPIPIPPPPLGDNASEDDKSVHEKERRRIDRAYKEALKEARLRQYNFHSQRIAARLKLDVAAEYANEPCFYFAHNIDFRGRVYAVGPHLQYLGDDLARGLLQFAQPKRLGENGLYWLKVQLANLYGKDKLPLHERVAWADEQLANGLVQQVDEAPLAAKAKAWWTAADNPVQTLAMCFELQAIVEAESRGEDVRFLSSVLPVHMDGSCNGLQHYAALGRDVVGGSQVNLTPGDRPSDVYAGVRELVEQKVARDAALRMTSELEMEAGGNARSDDDKERPADEIIKLARMLDGLISRKVVKQTVMTSVYGVTFVGARDQILGRLGDVQDEGGFCEPVSRDTLRQMAKYTARLTLSSLDEVFTGATLAMKWLAAVAQQISRDLPDQPVVWVTPMGWPVLQPYFRVKRRRIQTAFNTMTILEPEQSQLLDDNSTAPVIKLKQRSAMPPNYVHSLDSTHMLMTATRCVNEGLTFAAVHDSFWTHACDVPFMNLVLREAFIDLHSSTNLEQLHQQLMQRFPNVKWDQVGPPPRQGDLDINVVRESTYFFS